MTSKRSPARPQHVVYHDTVAARGSYDIDEFCAAHRISRSALYDLWAIGKGPRRKMVGARVTIPVEAAADWRNEPGDAA